MTQKQKKAVEKAKASLLRAINNSDTEEAHVDADDALCELLKALGHQDVVELYEKVSKWYA